MYGFAFFNKLYDKAGSKNLNSVAEDEKNVDSLFQLMQIMEGNIYKFIDATHDEIKKAFIKIEKIATLAKTKTPAQKVLFVVWYGGHGEMFDGSATTQVLTNDLDETKKRFPFEQKLADISFLNNTYFIAFMDCCRKQVKNYCLERILILELIL